MRLQGSSGEALGRKTGEGHTHGKGQTGGVEMEDEKKGTRKASKSRAKCVLPVELTQPSEKNERRRGKVKGRGRQ